jgi:hypothetical protein
MNPPKTYRSGLESYQDLPGQGQPIGSSKKYVCPKGGVFCDYWFPLKAGQEIPKCRKHGITLVLEEQEEETRS